MAQESFAEYIARLRACEKLSESDRNEAADQLEKWEDGEKKGVNYDKYKTWHDRGGILAAVTWSRTPQGHHFWKKIYDAGF